MATHMTLRLAWHNDGWNGRICKQPEKNTYCVGCSSYPGQMIREQRDLDWEKKHAGKLISEVDGAPPCMYSASAFSDEACEVYSQPPDFFNDDTERRHWELAPATACTWPYEAMYNRDDIKNHNGRYDYDKRLKYQEEHFAAIEASRSLVFYYANYSNPVSDNEDPRYLLIGVARIKQVTPTIYYENCSEQTLDRYKGFVWQRGITSDYPDNGVRLPYHRYIDQPDQLRKFAISPENNGLCKYATKHVSDDEALGLVEQLLEATRIVRDDLQDDSENWNQRIAWLENLGAELWRSRGAYPGMAAVLEYLGLSEAISGFREQVAKGEEQQAVTEVRAFLNGEAESVTGYYPIDGELKALRRNILLSMDDRPEFFLESLARCALTVKQLKAILGEQCESFGITSSIDELAENPYQLCEQYTGADSDDAIRWSTVDRGMLPSPELSAQPRFERNASERLRALLLETIRGNQQQTFLRASDLLNQVNHRVAAQPEWKQNALSEKYLKVDKEFYDEVIHQRFEDDINYLYDRRIWTDERLVQNALDDLLVAPDIQLKRPVGEGFWDKTLFNEQSPLAANARKEYSQAVAIQKAACESIISKRFAAITGGAGTGKTTILSSLIKAIRKVHGEGSGVAVIAPTGKATDRLRRSFDDAGLGGVNTSTIHSILARYGWLNSNLSFRMRGGKAVAEYDTVIIDESSMIDLSLMAALFRAINWDSVRQLILVGDAAQLPPIGVGKVYADIVSYMRSEFSDHLVSLDINLRQLENRVADKGNGIVGLAHCFINSAVRGSTDETFAEKSEREAIVQRLHEGGDVDKDLRVIYWSDAEILHKTIIESVTADLRTPETADVTDAKVWGDRLKADINCMQILSPVRGELHGTEAINLEVQSFKSSYWLNKGSVDGITLFDKVIQYVNRPASRPLKGYNFDTRSVEKLEIFNGEIGNVVPTGKDWKQFKRPFFRLKNFSVQFSGKENVSVNYGGADSPERNLELAYAISVHKSQGSEFDRVYFVIPKAKSLSSQMMELIYTALTRASAHCTIFVQDDVGTLVDAMRPEQSALKGINSSLFQFNPVSEAFATRGDWYEAGRIHQALTGDMVRSKSEVIIANLMHERGVGFWYEQPLIAPDGTMVLPDFTIQAHGEKHYWEHVGMLSEPAYEKRWAEKKAWYEKHFPGQLHTTVEGPELSHEASAVLKQISGK